MVRDLATLVTLCFVWENLVYLLYCIKASSSALFARHKSWHHHLYKTPPPPPSSQNQNQKIRYSSWHRLQFGAAQSPGQPHKKEQICNKSRDLSRFECESQFLEATFQEGVFVKHNWSLHQISIWDFCPLTFKPFKKVWQPGIISLLIASSTKERRTKLETVKLHRNKVETFFIARRSQCMHFVISSEMHLLLLPSFKGQAGTLICEISRLIC